MARCPAWVPQEEHDLGRRTQHEEVSIRQTHLASEDSPAAGDLERG